MLEDPVGGEFLVKWPSACELAYQRSAPPIGGASLEPLVRLRRTLSIQAKANFQIGSGGQEFFPDAQVCSQAAFGRVPRLSEPKARRL